jgi:hypothetical protein
MTSEGGNTPAALHHAFYSASAAWARSAGRTESHMPRVPQVFTMLEIGDHDPWNGAITMLWNE